MLRTGASRLAFKSLAAPTAPCFQHATLPRQWAASFSSMTAKRPQVLPSAHLKPVQAAILRRNLAGKIDREAENRYAQERIEPTPETVSSTSSVRPTFGEVEGARTANKEVEVKSGIKADLETIKDTFDLSSVPRQAYYIGLAGVLPYLGTSLSTVACAYEINHANAAGMGYLLSAQTAEDMLHFLEPLQIGYGAVILSFLGAIHWGLEWAAFGGTQGYRRYAIGVVAPAVAWPTVLMPIEYALLTQFAAFIMLYYVDSRATTRGWTPPWYSIYRFVLTFIVGASIVVSLIGRGEVGDRVVRIPGAVDRMKTLKEGAQDVLAEEEEAIRAENAAKQADSSEDSGKKSAV